MDVYFGSLQQHLAMNALASVEHRLMNSFLSFRLPGPLDVLIGPVDHQKAADVATLREHGLEDARLAMGFANADAQSVRSSLNVKAAVTLMQGVILAMYFTTSKTPM
ncbi:hypothetical protein PpBr36_09021 [Pyricularia pennisetigena]|uniref:hypothetical protein n=1 Tax=Pyricularia pennisetigena TaxID=1578925 RepID=UPI00115419B4|nr:hypothetical protein PpBr36_09021 [Pyricularia pennisetigena]TLS24438.1 hypothetical protein PpBr36_09021 [Pyricularia pennisetigena]